MYSLPPTTLTRTVPSDVDSAPTAPRRADGFLTGTSNPSFYSSSLLAAFVPLTVSFLHCSFQVFLPQMPVAQGGLLFSPLPRPSPFLLSHKPSKHAAASQVYFQGFCLAGRWQKWVPYWDWVIGGKFNVRTSQGCAKVTGRPKGSAVPRSCNIGTSNTRCH